MYMYFHFKSYLEVGRRYGCDILVDYLREQLEKK